MSDMRLEGAEETMIDDERTLNESDLEGYARRISFRSRESLEAHDQTWVYLPSFHETVYAEALQILKTVVLHQRQQAERGSR